MTDSPLLKNRNTALYEALKLFAVEALQVLAKAVSDGARVPVFNELAWQWEVQVGSFARRQITKPGYWLLVHSAGQSIESLATYQRARIAIQEDALWCGHMNKLVGSAMGASRFDLDGVLKGIPARSLRETQQLELSEQHFDEQVDCLERTFKSSTVEYVRTTPLYGVTLQDNFLFSDAISFEPLSDDDIIQLLEAGMVSSNFNSPGGDFVHNPPRAAIVSRFSMPKVVRGDGDSKEPDLHAVTELWNRLSVDESMAIDLLSLTLDVAIMPIGSVTKSLGATNVGSQIQKNAIANTWALPNKILSTEAMHKFCDLWSVVSEGTKKSRHFLTIAVRRYALALSRPSLDDKLIDLMICAEALFLRVEQNELTHKLAYRAALLLGKNPTQQRDIFKFIGEAYSMRSKVVHGAKSYTQDPKDSAQLSSIITRLSELLRQALLKMLALALNPQAPSELIDWKELMFRETASLDATDENNSGTLTNPAIHP